MARWFILAGILMIIAGLVLHYTPWLVNWFGKLPGDIRYESGHGRVYIPLTSMLLISIVLTILINIIRRLF